MFQRIVAAAMLAGLLGSIAGCYTVQGAGKDIEQGGQAVEKAAKDVQKKL